jgi:PglZ domain
VANWRDQILKEFTPQVARLTLVADPDGLLLEETLLQAIRERGFELIPFEDHVAFRFAYESKFRSHWDRGEITDLVVVLRAERHDLSTLPFDLLQAGRQLSFSLGELFRNLSYPVIASLDRSDLDALYRAQARHKPDRLGDNATKDFVLLHVFEIAAELIKQPSELLRVLLRCHYRRQRVPKLLDERLVQVLRQSRVFDSWPIETIVPDREAFFAFLQERWPLFLDRLAADAGKGLQEEGEPYGLKIKGPRDLPFDHDDIRVYIDNLFFEGLLRPVAHRCGSTLSDKWVAAGIQIDLAADRLRRLDGLVETVGATIPASESRHRDWSVFAYRWAELSVLWSDVASIAPMETGQRVSTLRSAVDQAFLSWIERRYAGLYNQPPDPPAMVHHLPRYLARQISDAADRKVALIIVDGIALDQWIVLRDVLVDQRPRLRLREGAVFAWVPTLTSVSRQAAFAGKPPLYFPSSIHTTDKEASLWTQFWVDYGLATFEVGYARGLRDGSLEGVRELASQSRLRALGLVVDKVDKIVHGMELGTAGMHNQVGQWASQQFIAELLDVLFDQGFIVFLTSDHGNIEAEGCGRPSEGAVADLRGERARVYPDQLLRSRVKQRFPHAIEWPALGLPEDYWPLLAPGRSAFVREGEHIVAHGGISIEEIVVPMVQIQRLPQ